MSPGEPSVDSDGRRSEETPPEGHAGPRSRGISLREMMLIAAIIALLGAMLTPSYRRAQERKEVARVRADQRSMATALESYFIDNMAYPACAKAEGPAFTVTAQNASEYPWLAQQFSYQIPFTLIPSGALTANSTCPPGSGARRLPTFRLIDGMSGSIPHTLTTPIAYMTSYFTDPFADSDDATFGYFSGPWGWIVWSPGPDRDENDPAGPTDIGPVVVEVYNPTIPQPSNALRLFAYDPTNGFRSDGDIFRVRQ